MTIEQADTQNPKNGAMQQPISLRPRYFTSSVDRAVSTKAVGSLEEALSSVSSLKDERLVSVSTRQMPLDVWNIVKNICWIYSRGAVNAKRSAIHAVIANKGALLLRDLPEYRELGASAHQSTKTDFRKHRRYAFYSLDYRFGVREFRNYRIMFPAKLNCQSSTKELMEDLAERYQTNLSLIAGMSVVAALSTASEEETVPMELVSWCGDELNHFKSEVQQLATPIRD